MIATMLSCSRQHETQEPTHALGATTPPHHHLCHLNMHTILPKIWENCALSFTITTALITFKCALSFMFSFCSVHKNLKSPATNAMTNCENFLLLYGINVVEQRRRRRWKTQRRRQWRWVIIIFLFAMSSTCFIYIIITKIIVMMARGFATTAAAASASATTALTRTHEFICFKS